MTKKHFEVIAAIVKWQVESEIEDASKAAHYIANDLADYFTGCNDNFDRQRFLKACGL